MARSSSILVVAVLASCILLATAVPVNSNRRGLKSVATAQEDGHVGKQEPATAAGYGGYREEQQYEEKRYDSDGDEKQYYGEKPSGPDYYHQQEEDYPKVEAKHLCLQESKRTTTAGIQSSDFRCCTPSDKPDSCVDPVDVDYDSMRDDMEPDFMNLVSLVSNPPANCKWKSGPGCPSWTQACFTMEVNCTVTAAAKDCGCPYSSGFMFMAKGYVAKVDAKGCEQTYVVPTAGTGRRLAAANYARANETFYTGEAWIFRGKINLIATTGGYKEAKGKVEFITDFTNGVAVNLTRRYGYGDDDDDDEYRGRDDEPRYGRDDEPRYGRDYDRKYGQDDDRKYGRDDEPKYGEPKYGRDDEPKYGRDDEPKYALNDDRKNSRDDEPKYALDDDRKNSRDEEHKYDRDEERKYDDRERQYGERRDSGPYEAKAQAKAPATTEAKAQAKAPAKTEAKAQGMGYGDEYSGGYDRPWLKAGNMKITLYETEYY